MAWFRNYYRCARCGHEWTDEWSATCEDDCPHCGLGTCRRSKAKTLARRATMSNVAAPTTLTASGC